MVHLAKEHSPFSLKCFGLNPNLLLKFGLSSKRRANHDDLDEKGPKKVVAYSNNIISQKMALALIKARQVIDEVEIAQKKLNQKQADLNEKKQ